MFRKCFPIWQSLHFYIYSVFHNSIAPSFWHDNHKNWVPFMLPHNLWLILIEMKQNAKQNQKWPNLKKCIFSSKLTLCRTAWQPYRLSHINALRINLSYSPKDQSLKFWQKNWELVILKNSRPFFLFLSFKKKFLLRPHENHSKFIG